MASGIKANDHCFEVYNDIKRKRKYLYAIFKIVAPDIVVDKTSDPGATFDDFFEDMKQRTESGCYAVLDFSAPGISGSHLVFTSWISDSLPVKTKMLYASSKDAFRRALDGIKFHIQAS
ncbi:cofilin, partial [Paragonimus westermani]